MESNVDEKKLAFDEETIRAFVGKNADYYLKKWRKAKDPVKNAGLNWITLLTGTFWLGYRKMYSIVCLFYGAYLLLDIAEIFFDIKLSKQIYFVFIFIIPVCANSLYYNHMKKRIDDIQHNYKDIEEQKAQIEKAGGTSWVGVGFAAVLALLYGLLAYNFYPESWFY